MDLSAWIGALASACSVASFTPQAWKIIRSRDVSAISRTMYLITTIGFALWTGYGLLLGRWPLIITNAICLVLAGFILLMKLLPPRRREALAAAIGPNTSAQLHDG